MAICTRFNVQAGASRAGRLVAGRQCDQLSHHKSGERATTPAATVRHSYNAISESLGSQLETTVPGNMHEEFMVGLLEGLFTWPQRHFQQPCKSSFTAVEIFFNGNSTFVKCDMIMFLMLVYGEESAVKLQQPFFIVWWLVSREKSLKKAIIMDGYIIRELECISPSDGMNRGNNWSGHPLQPWLQPWLQWLLTSEM